MIPDFEWDDANVEHISRHGVSLYDAQEALLDPDVIVSRASRHGDEQRWNAIGTTESGWVLFIVFTRRGGWLRVVTGHGATEAEKRRYRRSRG